MTSISKKSAHGGAVLKNSMTNKTNINGYSECLEAETIEVVPELPFQDDSDAGYSEFSDEFNSGIDEDEPFDEYAYQVNTNHRESPPSHGLWFDNSQLRAMPLVNGSEKTTECDVILIDDGEVNEINRNDDNQFAKKNHNRGLSIHNEQKFHICKICDSKLSSSYNLKRHMMIHTGEKPFECLLCHRRFREQSDLRKHKKVHESDLTLKCSVCHKRPISSRNTMKCMDCEKQAAAKIAMAAIAAAAAAAAVATKKTKLAELDVIITKPRTDPNHRKSFVCKFCSRTFGSSSNLKRHEMIHTGIKPFNCEQCSRPFREMSTLKKHMITHRKQNGFQMNSTSKMKNDDNNTTKKSIDLKQSNKEQSTTEQIINFHKCPLCMTVCKGTEGLMSHIIIHRTSKKRSDDKPSETIGRKLLSKSPPPLIPINRATFNYSKVKRF